jgi:hypothetical protein
VEGLLLLLLFLPRNTTPNAIYVKKIERRALLGRPRNRWDIIIK